VVSGSGLSAEEDAAEAAAAVEDRFVIRSYNGKVALFAEGFAAVPAVEIDIDVSLLRAYDRELLENGIIADTFEDVLRLLEDLGS